jgi:alpha-D-xyloside xylohydrolase
MAEFIDESGKLIFINVTKGQSSKNTGELRGIYKVTAYDKEPHALTLVHHAMTKNLLLSLALLPALHARAEATQDIRITPVAANIVRVQVMPKGVGANPKKYSALVAPPVAFTGECDIVTKTEDGVIRFSDKSGRVFLTQTASSFGQSKVGAADFRSVTLGWRSGEADGLYGLGAFQDGHLDIRGHELACHQKNLEDTVPMLVSTAGFGIFWDNAAPFVFKADAKDTGFSLASATGGEADYYVILDTNPNAVIAGYRKLTGASPMLPKWAFGYHQSKERYQSQGEILAIAKEFRDRRFPLDLIIQDWQYWGGHGWNACVFDTARFPDAKAMIGKLHADNIRYITSVWPNFADGPKGSAVFKELNAMGVISKQAKCMGGHYYDAFNDAARDVVWKHAKKGLFDVGVDGWWLDASEPVAGGTGPNGGHQTAGDVYTFGATCAQGPFPAVANAYPFFAVKAFHDGQRATETAKSAGKRFYTLTRSVYAGSQRLGACYWTGDTRSTWASFKNQIPACLNMSAAGIPYVNTDVGGFAIGPDAELAVRWVQFGAFCGEFRVHGTGAPREPWRYGKPGDTAYDTMLDFANLRYRLLPYIYSTAWRITDAGDSLMRPLALDFPKDTAVRDCADEFMFGPSLLVAPVTTPCGGVGRTIPPEALCGKDGKPGGLDATYFKGVNFATETLRRKDAEIRFAWAKKPREGMGADPALDPISALGDMDKFSVRWTGSLKTGAAGKYAFTLSGDDGFRLKLDGREVCADWRARPAVTKSFTVDLPANKLVPVELEYFQDFHDAAIEWKWTPPGEKADGTATRVVTLPAGADWYDFKSGAKHAGGGVLKLYVPLADMPLFVRAGSILPFGPALQHTGEKSDAPLELRVYPGVDATFTLYDDAGNGYGYEKGERATITLTWNDATRTFTLGKREGAYPGMETTWKFTVRLLQADGAWKDTPVVYDGGAQRVNL